MTINYASLLKYVENTNRTSGSNGTTGAQSSEYAWSAGGLFNDLGYLLSLFGVNEAGTANTEVQENENAANTIDEAVKTTENNVNTRVNEIIAQMQATAQEVQTRIENIEEDNKEKEKYQKNIQEHLQTIDVCKGILENQNSTSAERTVAIQKLKAAGKGISEISEAIKGLEKSTTENQEAVEQTSDTQEGVAADFTDAIDEGKSQIEKAATQAAKEQAKNAVTAAKGATNEVVSVSAKTFAETIRASAKGLSILPVGGAAISSAANALAQKLDQVSSDQGQAGSSRVPSAAKTQTQIAASGAAMQATLTMFKDFSQYALGELDPKVREFTDTFYSFLEPLGKWVEQGEDVASQSENLNNATQKASEQVDAEKKEEVKPAEEADGDTPQNDGVVKLEFQPDDLKDLLA